MAVRPSRLQAALADTLAFTAAVGAALWASRLLYAPSPRPPVLPARRHGRAGTRRHRVIAPPPAPEHGAERPLADRAALADPDAAAKGRWADRPWEMPWRGWRAVLVRTFKEVSSDRIGLVAAGCAFWATLSLFPAISTLITIYGLLFNPADVESQLAVLSRLLPPAAFSLIAKRVHELVSQPAHTLTIGLFVSIAITLWSSATGTKSILSALNMAYEEEERRSFLVFQAEALLLTIAAILAAVLALAIMVGLPAIFTFMGASKHLKSLIATAGWVVLVGFVIISLALLYRFGPSRRPAKWHWITPGSVTATILWLAASALFSIYVGRFASYNATYGPIGTVAGVMMWFWVSVYAVLLGAELNAELELQTARDTTPGPPKPMGRRGAFVADHVAQS
ncbi:MAG: YihY/virulence factor BrkB family protein [Alphaproteobacteria bacterium]|nr:YihY/virulence factor BrkB family protein [Alphaproteobacteria bacterium]